MRMVMASLMILALTASAYAGCPNGTCAQPQQFALPQQSYGAGGCGAQQSFALPQQSYADPVLLQQQSYGVSVRRASLYGAGVGTYGYGGGVGLGVRLRVRQPVLVAPAPVVIRRGLFLRAGPVRLRIH